MKPDDRAILIQLRLTQASETLHESQVLIEQNSPRGAINRAYYAMFYALQALALQKQQPVSKHTGILSFFDREFVKTGIFEPSFSRAIHAAFEQRQKSDYRETSQPSFDMAKNTFNDAKNFVKAVSDYLTQSLV